jgi:hypothetical protein
MSQWKRSCLNCNRTFNKEFDEQTWCYPCLERERLRQASLNLTVGRESTCAHCAKKFRNISRNRLKYCSDACRVKGIRSTKSLKKEPKKTKKVDKKIVEMNESWLSEKKKRKGLPLEVFIKMSEYKRVFDDSGWSHYLSGRKWDKI